VRAAVAISAFTTETHEAAGKWRGIGATGGFRLRAQLGFEYVWSSQLTARQERRAYAEADRLFVNYRSVRDILAAEGGPAGRCRFLPYAAETAFRDRDNALLAHRGQPDGVPTLLAVSRHDPRKGLEGLIRALADLNRAGVQFRANLIGTGSLLEAHHRLVSTLGLEGRVSVLGFVPDAWPLFGGADVFVLPSIEEASGSLSLLEALQAGLPVVASNIDGIHEDVTDGVEGLLVPPGDVLALAAALKRLLVDEPMRRRMGAAARRTFESRFTAERFTTALADAYAGMGFVPWADPTRVG
jgi:glycosyltransferase involved in cell wall biosynthesis